MPGIRRFSKSIRTLDNVKENVLIEFPGVLGVAFKDQQYVDVPNRDGYVYVRLRSNLNEVIQAYNSVVSPVYDLPVLVTRDKTFERWLIKGRDLGRYQDWGSTPYLPRHGAQHSFNDTHPGGDIVWVFDRQFTPLSISPSGAFGAGDVVVNGDMIYLNGTWIYAGNTGTTDIVGYKPTNANAKLAIVYLDVHGNPNVLASSEFSSSLTGLSQFIPYLPTLPSTEDIPIGAVRLLSGTSTINWGNIYDLRNFFVGVGGGGGHVIEDEGTPLTQRVNLDVRGGIVWATDDAGGNASRISVSGTHVQQKSTAPSGTFPGMLWLKTP